MWHYLPDTASPSVQAAADLTWVLSLPARALPPPHMSSGRNTPAKHSSPRNERDTSHPHRSGETSGSSTPDPSAESSTPFVLDTHVSRFPKRARERARTTRAISGRTSPASLRRAVPNGPSSKNVAGHLSLGLETVLRELWGMGFTPAAGLFSAEETGASHERQRVFILAHRRRVGAREPDNPAGTKSREPDTGKCSRAWRAT